MVDKLSVVEAETDPVEDVKEETLDSVVEALTEVIKELSKTVLAIEVELASVDVIEALTLEEMLVKVVGTAEAELRRLSVAEETDAVVLAETLSVALIDAPSVEIVD